MLDIMQYRIASHFIIARGNETWKRAKKSKYESLQRRPLEILLNIKCFEYTSTKYSKDDLGS